MTNPSHYRKIAEIGRGGMAAVYKAKHTATKVEVALKRPMPWDGCNDRLRHEAHFLASIDHLHVIPVLDTGTDSAGQHWYVMP